MQRDEKAIRAKVGSAHPTYPPYSFSHWSLQSKCKHQDERRSKLIPNKHILTSVVAWLYFLGCVVNATRQEGKKARRQEAKIDQNEILNPESCRAYPSWGWCESSAYRHAAQLMQLSEANRALVLKSKDCECSLLAKAPYRQLPRFLFVLCLFFFYLCLLPCTTDTTFISSLRNRDTQYHVPRTNCTTTSRMQEEPSTSTDHKYPFVELICCTRPCVQSRASNPATRLSPHQPPGRSHSMHKQLSTFFLNRKTSHTLRNGTTRRRNNIL